MRRSALRTSRVVAVLILVILTFLVLVRTGWFYIRWAVPFSMILLLIALSTVYWWAWVDELLRPGGLSPFRKTRAQASVLGSPAAKEREMGTVPPLLSGRTRRWMRVAWSAYMAAMVAPLLLSIFVRAMLHDRQPIWDQLPVPAIIWAMTWHLLLVGLASVSAICWAAWLVYRLLVRHKPAEPVNESRRRLLLGGVAAAPLVLTGAGLVTGAIQGGRFRVRRLRMALPRLPDRLRGLTITQISDIHVGRLFRPEHLPHLVDEANALKSDLVVVTGDIVDHSDEYLPAACDAIAQLEHRYGRFQVVGNHDLIDSPREFLRYVSGREPGLLLDRHVRLNIDGEPLQIAGLTWSSYEQTGPKAIRMSGLAEKALAGADPSAFTIALAHHPHAFDPLADLGADLTLSGHTHAGQLMLTPTWLPWRFGAGTLLFRYIWGEYWRGRSALYVNAGVGNWFPIRINAPAEIVQIRLV